MDIVWDEKNLAALEMYGITKRLAENIIFGAGVVVLEGDSGYIIFENTIQNRHYRLFLEVTVEGKYYPVRGFQIANRSLPMEII